MNDEWILVINNKGVWGTRRIVSVRTLKKKIDSVWALTG